MHPEQMLRTRRDFLRAGIITSAASVTVPSVVSLLFAERVARADGLVCGGGAGAAGMTPYFEIHGAGGFAIGGDILPLDAGGQPLPSYELQGRGTNQNDYKTISDMGHPYSVTHEVATPEGLQTSTLDCPIGDQLFSLSPEIKARTGIVMVCFASGSDSAANPLALSPLIAKAGRKGKMLPGLGVSGNSSSGGRHDGALGAHGHDQILQVNDLAALTTALNFGVGVADSKVSSLDKAINSFGRLSDSQAKGFMSLNLGEQFANLFGCSLISNHQFTNPAAGGVDPRPVEAVQRVYGNLTAAQMAALEASPPLPADDRVLMAAKAAMAAFAALPTNNAMVVEATLVYNTLMGNCSTATLEEGGCDYHDGGRTTGSARNKSIGGKITRILKLADLLGSDAFINVSTDGGISAAGAAGTYMGDNNQTSGEQLIYMAAPGKARPTLNSVQIGAYTPNGVVDTSNYWGNANTAGQHAALVAYLGLHGKVDYEDYKKLFGIGSDQAHARVARHADALVFGKKAA